uniref:Dirigent protein n=1 Tax=Steinernema glaseri TaxID=37863 RepID=A0A1I8A1T1_9BILA
MDGAPREENIGPVAPRTEPSALACAASSFPILSGPKFATSDSNYVLRPNLKLSRSKVYGPDTKGSSVMVISVEDTSNTSDVTALIVAGPL